MKHGKTKLVPFEVQLKWFMVQHLPFKNDKMLQTNKNNLGINVVGDRAFLQEQWDAT